jgi:NAD(P)-dependent dehydrogenase (short-subunit alcohol dehydrogenase family)
MGSLEGRVAIITGAGRGLGREHALLFAREGAKVVVNDLGGDASGGGADPTPAEQVVQDIKDLGGEAVVNGASVSDWNAARELVEQAVETFGRLDVLVNNAGILRDRVLVNLAEDEWDSVIDVHLKGHVAPLHWAAVHWREQVKAGRDVNASVINTSSTSGLLSNAGQANYGAAKSGIATLTEIAGKELVRYGVRVNAICPAAATRLTLATPGFEETIAKERGGFDRWDPANVSPFVAYLATAACRINGKVFFVRGGDIALFRPWTIAETITADRRWTIDELEKAADTFADVTFDQGTANLA